MPWLTGAALGASLCALTTGSVLDDALPRGWNRDARWAEGACGPAAAQVRACPHRHRGSRWLSSLADVKVAVGTVRPVHDSPHPEVLLGSWTGRRSNRDPARSSGDRVLVSCCEKEFKAGTNSTREARVY